jgi:diguanylate cyclase (GGDEF)-like protein/PAS domain S-box-containing protein
VVDLHDISINRDPTELRKMLDYLGIAAFVIDVVSVDEFRLAAINARHEQLTGMKNSDVAGHSVDELLSPEMAAEVKSRYRRCVESKSATDYQERLELPAGTTFWFYRDVTELHRFTEKLLHLSQTDSLTGIANRRALIEALEKEYSRARRHGYALSIWMLDIDHFKMVNDRYGHAAGDTMLSEFVQIIAPEIRDSDYFGRLGGEEFAILLPECSLGSAQQLAERIRRAVAADTFRSSQARFNVTMSIGVATLIDDDARPDHVLNRADRCLYAAKSEGRNCVRPLDGSDHCENGDSAVE